MRTPSLPKTIGPALFVLTATAAGTLLGSYSQYLLSLILISAVTGAALTLIVGYARIIMLATGAMMAIGAYGSAVLVTHAGLSYAVTLLLSLGLGLLSGIVLALPSTRFRGHHLAMVTMVFQFLVIIAIREGGELTGGSLGLRFPEIDTLNLITDRDTRGLVLTGLASAAVLYLLAIFMIGRFGKTLKAISASEIAADAYGVHIGRFQMAAFAISSAILAYAGALLGPRLRILDPDSFGIAHSIMALAYPIVGGMDSIWGGLLGGALLKWLPESLRLVGKYQEFIVAGLVIVTMIFWPRGLLALFGSRRPAATQAAATDNLPISTSPGAEALMPSASFASAQAVKRIKPQSASNAIEVVGVSKHFGALKAVNNVDLHVRAGEIHGLIGPNGAGKTTLFNIISGFSHADNGHIRLFDHDIQNQPSFTRIHAGVTRTFQHVAIFHTLSCLDNVLIGLGRNHVLQSLQASFAEVLHTAASHREMQAAMEALTKVGLVELAQTPAGALSLGNQRRLEIARAIVSHPRLILLDEPVSGVAQEEEAQIADLLRQLNATMGITMLIVEHNIPFVRSLCEHVTIMVAGERFAQGIPDEILDTEAVRRVYFGEAA